MRSTLSTPRFGLERRYRLPNDGAVFTTRSSAVHGAMAFTSDESAPHPLARVMQDAKRFTFSESMDIPSGLEDLTSIDHRATALLRREHEVILGAFRQLREAPRGAQDPREASAQRIAVLLELHDRVERSIVYPALAPYYGPLVRALTVEHDQIAACIAALREGLVETNDSRANLDRLERLARDHIALEETSLLTPVERDQPGLNSRLYASMVAEKERLAGAVKDLESRS